jgi:hypothetical protein
MTIYQHYDQEYVFPEADPLLGPPHWTWDLIPEADPKQHGCRRRGRRAGLLVRLRRQAHHTPLPSILLANVHITRWTKLGYELPSRETSEIVTFSVSQRHGSLGICCRSRHSHLVSSCIAPTETNINLVRKEAGLHAL